MPEQMGRCNNRTVSFGIRGFESDEGPGILCSDADASFSFAVPHLLFVIAHNVVWNFGIFCTTVCDEQTVLFAISSFVNHSVVGLHKDEGGFLESINFLYIQSDQRRRVDVGVGWGDLFVYHIFSLAQLQAVTCWE